ncbi:MAG: radical SAM protein [Anaerolineae bacterium]
MTVREIQARTLVSSHARPDPWFGLRYNFNIYRGCQHGCIYCDSRSLCYGIEDFDEILVKANALERLADELPRKRVKGLVGTGSMSDPYGPVEADLRLTRGALEIIARLGFPLHLITKSDLVVRDTDLLAQIAGTACYVSFTITTTDDDLAAILEPRAPSPTRRLAAIRALTDAGVTAGVTLMPVLPYLEDTEENVAAVITQAAEAGARYLIPAFSMTLRDRQRDYYYAALDQHFPGLSNRYRRRYGDQYGCPSDRAARLEKVSSELVERYGLATRVPPWEAAAQPTLF